MRAALVLACVLAVCSAARLPGLLDRLQEGVARTRAMHRSATDGGVLESKDVEVMVGSDDYKR